MIAPTSVDTNLNQLLDEVNNGKIQLSEFQRSWTWDDNRIRGIIASLTQGYPMGAIMRLQYGNPEIKFKYRPIEGVKIVNVVPDYLVLTLAAFKWICRQVRARCTEFESNFADVSEQSCRRFRSIQSQN